jgi:dihydrolipoamide dehydrogenase
MKSFDVAVIGGGPGGYIAAIRAAQLGLSVACIDEAKGADGKPALGGTCTNVGCIPSKALLQSSENYEQAGHHFGEHGVKVKGLELDLKVMLARKDKVVKGSNDGVLYLFKKNKVSFFHGRASFLKPLEIKVNEETISAKNVIIATGSNPRALPGADFDEKLILSNDGALAIPEVPKRLGVIGAGVIGLEMGSVWRRLGAEVTILEALPTFLGRGRTIAREAAEVFAEAGPDDRTGVKITKSIKGLVTVQYNAADNSPNFECDRLIVPSAGCQYDRPECRGSASSSIGASSPWTANAAPACRASGRSATWCAARCSRTRRRKRAWRWPSALPARSRT